MSKGLKEIHLTQMTKTSWLSGQNVHETLAQVLGKLPKFSDERLLSVSRHQMMPRFIKYRMRLP